MLPQTFYMNWFILSIIFFFTFIMFFIKLYFFK